MTEKKLMSLETVQRHADRLNGPDHTAVALRVYLKETRGLTEETIQKYKLGLASWGGHDWLLIPLRSGKEALVHWKWIAFDADASRWALDGGKKIERASNPTCLYPLSSLAQGEDRPVIVCEGEFDALLACQHGYRAVTGTGGAGTWKPAWSAEFAVASPPAVVVCYDGDEAGRAGADKVAASLANEGMSVRVAEMPKDQDVSDVLNLAGKDGLDAILSSAKPFGPADSKKEEKAEGKKERPPSAADVLLALADPFDLFHTPDNDPHATVTVEGVEKTFAVRSGAFCNLLRSAYLRHEGKAPTQSALQDVVNTLAAKAEFEGRQAEVYRRVAYVKGRVYVDLCDEMWRVVEIDTEGYRLLDRSPVPFVRSRTSLALPVPAEVGDLAALRSVINAPDEDTWALIVGWLLSCLRPDFALPVLIVEGEQGSAKSTLAKMLVGLVDPQKAEARTPPKDVDALMSGARNAYVLAYDNVSRLRPWFSDALCRLSTGGAFTKRQLYTDFDEASVEAKRPVILNGIDELVERNDLRERSIQLYLPSIEASERLLESEVWKEYDSVKPSVLAGLYSAVSIALRNLPDVQLEERPRLADFAEWATAGGTGAGLEEDGFIEAYWRNLRSSEAQSVEYDAVAGAVADLVRHLSDEWEGTATELLDLLGTLVSEDVRRSRSWPGNARALSSRLRRAAPVLGRSAGVRLEFGRSRDRASSRLITVRREFSVGSDRSDRTRSGTARAQEDTDATDAADANFRGPALPPVRSMVETPEGGDTLSEWAEDGSAEVIVSRQGEYAKRSFSREEIAAIPDNL